MICYLIRHGQDDETVRGGWSHAPLTETGIDQAEKLAEKLSEYNLAAIYSSDLERAQQTAKILGDQIGLQVSVLPQFREVNNGALAGMRNADALAQYPDLFWNQLDWEQCYPDGESPKIFYERICSAWDAFSKMILLQKSDVALVTHGGVIHVILAIMENRAYSNKEKQRKVAYTEVIPLAYENGVWKEV